MTESGQIPEAKKIPDVDSFPKYPFYVEAPDTPDKAGRFLNAFTAVLDNTDYRSLLDTYSITNTKCNRCAVSCPIFQVTGNPKDIPCYRSNLLLNIYRRYFTLSGKLKSRFSDSLRLTDDIVEEMADLFYKCTGCRRCTSECPMGIDHGLIVRLGRYVLSLIGIVPKALQVSVREQLAGETKNTSKIPKAALIDTLGFLSEEMEDLLNLKLEFPIDKKNRDYVFFCAVSDYLLEPDTLMGNAAVLYAAGDWDRWTIGTGNYDGINYGLFYSDWHLESIIRQEVEEVRRLKGKNLLIGECGHASRSARDFIPVFGGAHTFPVFSFLEYTHRCLKEGKITLNPDIITEKVTYHDPCNMARSGWIVNQPREILKSFVPNFVEMTPNGKANYCCGGGGGSVSIDEMHDYRMCIGGKIKADQIKATGAEIVVAPCANCKKQLKELIEYYELPCKLMGLHDLILKVIEIPGCKSPEERLEEAKMMEM